MPAHSDVPSWLWLDQRRWSVCRRGYWTLSSLVVNMTNLFIVNVETMSHDHGYTYSFSSDGHQFGGTWPLAPLWIRHWSWLHRLEILETNCTDNYPNTFALCSPKAIRLLPEKQNHCTLLHSPPLTPGDATGDRRGLTWLICVDYKAAK